MEGLGLTEEPKAVRVVIDSAIFASSDFSYYCTVQLNQDGEKVSIS